MTTTDPQPLSSVLDDALNGWQETTGQRPPLAIWCAEPHPWDDLTLCRRLDGHSGNHLSDGGDDWTDNDTSPGRTA